MLDALGKQPNLLRFGVTTAALALGDLLLLRTPLAMRRTASPNGSAIASRLLQLSVPSRGRSTVATSIFAGGCRNTRPSASFAVLNSTNSSPYLLERSNADENLGIGTC